MSSNANGHCPRGTDKGSQDYGSSFENGTADPSRLHRISEVRERQGVSLRTAARQWNTEIASVRDQEKPDADLKLSELYAWQRLLNVPVAELLVDMDEPLSTPVLRRAQLVRLMKTAVTLQHRSRQASVKRLSEMLIEQLVELMPELSEVGPWRGNEGETSARQRDLLIYSLPDETFSAD